MSPSASCQFCTLPASRVVAEGALCVVIRDAYPVSPGHTLVIPKRHVGSFFDLRDEERQALLALLDQAKVQLDAEF
ncbi:MAG: HIT family protein, partial [Betaproteobacteria bacterium]